VDAPSSNGLEAEIARNNEKLFLRKLLQLAGNQEGNQQVAAVALYRVNKMERNLNSRSSSDAAAQAHQAYMGFQISQFKKDPAGFKLPEAPSLPDGSPIGCGH